jgi:hypothetical protein
MISIRVDLPDVDFARKKWLDKIATAQRKESVKQLRSLFNKTVYGWSTKPRMGYVQTKSPSEIVLRIYPTGPGSDTWNLLNVGSPRHDIFPKRRGGFLRFRHRPGGYRSATTPGTLQSRRKYRSGPTIIRPYVIDHPGFEPRDFTGMIAEEYANRYAMDMQAAVNEAAYST